MGRRQVVLGPNPADNVRKCIEALAEHPDVFWGPRGLLVARLGIVSQWRDDGPWLRAGDPLEPRRPHGFYGEHWVYRRGCECVDRAVDHLGDHIHLGEWVDVETMMVETHPKTHRLVLLLSEVSDLHKVVRGKEVATQPQLNLMRLVLASKDFAPIRKVSLRPMGRHGERQVLFTNGSPLMWGEPGESRPVVDEAAKLRQELDEYRMAEVGPSALESSLGLGPRCGHCGRRTDGGACCARCLADETRR